MVGQHVLLYVSVCARQSNGIEKRENRCRTSECQTRSEPDAGAEAAAAATAAAAASFAHFATANFSQFFLLLFPTLNIWKTLRQIWSLIPSFFPWSGCEFLEWNWISVLVISFLLLWLLLLCVFLLERNYSSDCFVAEYLLPLLRLLSDNHFCFFTCFPVRLFLVHLVQIFSSR